MRGGLWSPSYPAARQRGRTLRGWAAASLALLLAVALVVAARSAAVTAAARADEITGSANTLRTGWDPNEPGLAPVSDGGPVGGPSFGQLFATPVDGQVYAQPIVAAGVVIVATENNWVYGLNPASGTVAWSLHLGTPWPSSSLNCTDLSPDVGVTGAPVYDPATQTVYLVALVDDGPTVYRPHYYMFAI